MMRKYHAGVGREGACFLPASLGAATHSYLRPGSGLRRSCFSDGELNCAGELTGRSNRKRSRQLPERWART